jgi:hypothetical protein
MTSISAAQRLHIRVETYLSGVFHPFPEERVIVGSIRSFYGWFFALLRNAFICGALQYFAEKSGSMTLQILVIIGYIVLAAYCLSYINLWVLTPFHFVKHKRLASWLDGLVTLAVLLLLLCAIWKGTAFAIDEIAKGHAASRSNASRNFPGPSWSSLVRDCTPLPAA